MTITNLKKLIDDKKKITLLLTKDLRTLQSEINGFRSQLYELELSTFLDYLQLEESIDLNNSFHFKGFSKNTEATNSFKPGERFKIVKKNKKSIIIEVTKKLQRKWDEVTKKQIIISEYNPGWIIRVDLESFFHFYFKTKLLKDSFDSYIKRKEALDNLLSD